MADVRLMYMILSETIEQRAYSLKEILIRSSSTNGISTDLDIWLHILQVTSSECIESYMMRKKLLIISMTTNSIIGVKT